ncbi:MAG: outer membrane lipoprotein-sorting protein [Deltaproteobacteria bacterium]|nr:outer membrane lipoprotein-sorting protein [Deltaproteobacteria bacterium]
MRGIILLFVGCMTCSFGAPAAQALTGEEIVAKMDKFLTQAKDQYFIYEVVTEEKGKPPRQLKFDVTIKGTKWRRIEYMEPGDLKGMKVLVLDTDTIWTYLPAYRKVRRVASHAKAQGFLGTALSHDEMSTVTYGGIYKGKLEKEDDKNWTVLLERREGSGAPYKELRMVIRKDISSPINVEYINDKGEKVKTETRSSYQCKANNEVCSPRIMVYTDHTRNGLKSTLVQRAWKVNQNVPDRFFTVRSLQRR